MIKLVQNELIKINTRKSTHVYTCLILLFALIGGIVYSRISEATPTWQNLSPTLKQVCVITELADFITDS